MKDTADIGIQRRSAMTKAGAVAIGVAAAMLVPRHQASAASGTFDSANSDPAVTATNTDAGPGVLATSVDGSGVRGISVNGNGVRGSSTGGNGLRGDSVSANGVRGTSDTGNGVRGEHTSASTGGTGVVAINSGLGNGLNASAANGSAVQAVNTGTGAGLFAKAANGFPVLALLDTGAAPGAAIAATNNAGGNAVFAQATSPSGDGVMATSVGGAGVSGFGGTTGVFGAAPGDSPAVHAQSGAIIPAGGVSQDGGLALLVDGQTVLRGSLSAQVGSGTISASEQAHAVSDANVKTTSHIAVMLSGTPRPDDGIAVSWIERAAGSFKIHLTGHPTVDVPFTYLVVNPS